MDKCYLKITSNILIRCNADCDGFNDDCKEYRTMHSKIIPTTAATTSKAVKIVKNENGALRQTREEKGYFRLIPYSLLNHMSQFYKQSSKKYPENNWRKGMDIKDCYDSAFRHMAKAIEMLNTGEKVGAEDEGLIHHLRATIWNITCILDDFDKKENKNV